MISDRISLNLAYLYLKKIQDNGGTITDIQFSISSHHSTYTKTLARFDNLTSLKIWIDENAPLTTFVNINCMNLNLYELKAFKMTKNSTTWLVESNERTWSGIQAECITPVLVQDYLLGGNNTEGCYGYTKCFNDVATKFFALQYDEYVLSQFEYIDCNYIQIYFEEDLTNLKELYTKYK